MTISATNQGLRPGVCTSTSRPSTPFDGQVIYETDTNRVLVYDNTAWVMIADTDTPPGLQLVSRSSFTSQSTVSFDNCFTSEFKNYRLVINTDDPASNQTVTMRLRSSSADNSNNSYYRLCHATNAGGVGQVTGQSTSFFVGYAGNTSRLTADVTVYSPQESVRTTMSGTGISNWSSFASITIFSLGGWFDATTQFDGFSILFGANTTGVIAVYGYRNS